MSPFAYNLSLFKGIHEGRISSFSKWLYHHQDYYGNQDYHRNFIKPAVINMTMAIAIVFKISEQFTAVYVIDNQHNHEREFGMQPPAGNAIAQPKPQSKENRQYRTGCHNSIIELAFHYFESLDTGRIITHSMIDKQARQIKEAGKPGNHENYVQ
jgi:hypothetical protein